MGCIHCIIEITKWLPVLVTSTAYAWSWYAYVFQLVAYNMQYLSKQIACLIVFQVFYTLSLWSYAKTIFTPQGRIPSKFQLSPEIVEDLTKAVNDQQRDEILAYVAKRNELPVYCRTYSGGIRYCDKCNIIKPDRCHHCSICRTCVLKMDHHCPWINNCVSFTNYKFFVLFLGYTFALCAFVALTTFPFFFRFWIPNAPSNATMVDNVNTTKPIGPQAGMSLVDDDIFTPTITQISFGIRIHILFLFFVSSMLSIGVVFLFSYHLYLLLGNRSTLEAFRPPLMTYGPDRNAFNLGRQQNLNQLFGRNKLLWIIPVYTTQGSGLTYDLRPQLFYDEEARQELLNHNANNNAINNINNNNNNNNERLNSNSDINRQNNTQL